MMTDVAIAPAAVGAAPLFPATLDWRGVDVVGDALTTVVLVVP